jgi:hypothetical protein
MMAGKYGEAHTNPKKKSARMEKDRKTSDQLVTRQELQRQIVEAEKQLSPEQNTKARQVPEQKLLAQKSCTKRGSEMKVPVMGLKRPVMVAILHDGKAPSRDILPAPDTRYLKAFASLDQGYNYYGSLKQEFFVCRDNGYEPKWTILWVTLNADQEDDSIQRIAPFCALSSRWQPEDLEDSIRSIVEDFDPAHSTVGLRAVGRRLGRTVLR